MRSTATVDIRAATISDIEARQELVRAHWDEVALNKDVMVLDPNWDLYRAMEAAGKLLILGAWDGEELVGYSVGFLMPHLHYQGLVYYQNDALFVAEAARKSRVGLRLIAESERAAAERGARFVCWHAKQGTALDALLSSRDTYRVQDIIYSRKL